MVEEILSQGSSMHFVVGKRRYSAELSGGGRKKSLVSLNYGLKSSVAFTPNWPDLLSMPQVNTNLLSLRRL